MRTSTRRWLRQIGAAMISGGSGSVVMAMTVNLIDPDHFNLSTVKGVLRLGGVVVSVFSFHGLLKVLEFLKRKPLPED